MDNMKTDAIQCPKCGQLAMIEVYFMDIGVIGIECPNCGERGAGAIKPTEEMTVLLPLQPVLRGLGNRAKMLLPCMN